MNTLITQNNNKENSGEKIYDLGIESKSSLALILGGDPSTKEKKIYEDQWIDKILSQNIELMGK